MFPLPFFFFFFARTPVYPSSSLMPSEKSSEPSKRLPLGVTVVTQRKQIQLVSMRTWIWSLASLSGLGTWHCHELWFRMQRWLGSHVAVAVSQASSCSSDSTPRLGASICCGSSPKKKAKKGRGSLPDLSPEQVCQIEHSSQPLGGAFFFSPYSYLHDFTHNHTYYISRSSHRGTAETNPSRNHEVVDLIPGFAQWIKDPVLPWAVVQFTDMARIRCCCGCDVGWWLQLLFDP